MKKTVDLFIEIPSLTEYKHLEKDSWKKWFKNADIRFRVEILQKFIKYNSEMFDFLNVYPKLVSENEKTTIVFRSSNFIGAIPLKSSVTGKQIGDLNVIPRYGFKNYDEFSDILTMLSKSINAEIKDSLPLVSGNNFRPPMYIEAVKFIATLEELLKKKWTKFDNIEKISNEPNGEINWNRYIENSYRIENSLKFPIRKNILSEYHNELAMLKYVYTICKKELTSLRTPIKIRIALSKSLSKLDEKLNFHKSLVTKLMVIKSSDNQTVKLCKEQANVILKSDLQISTAWRIDMAEVFEKFVQYIFTQASKELGGKFISNFKLPSNNRDSPPWALKHLEPDGIFEKDGVSIFIDAKYKSNLIFKGNTSDILKDEHRHDLHQILAYSSFSSQSNKLSILCYPSEEIYTKSLEYNYFNNNVSNSVVILGIPFKRDKIVCSKDEIKKIINYYLEKIVIH